MKRTDPLEKLKFPIGRVNLPEIISEMHLAEWIEILEEFPEKPDKITRSLSVDQLNTPDRQGDWI